MLENKVKKEIKTFHQGVVGLEFVGPHCVSCRFDDSAEDAVNTRSLSAFEFPNGSPNLISGDGTVKSVLVDWEGPQVVESVVDVLLVVVVVFGLFLRAWVGKSFPESFPDLQDFKGVRFTFGDMIILHFYHGWGADRATEATHQAVGFAPEQFGVCLIIFDVDESVEFSKFFSRCACTEDSGFGQSIVSHCH
jgi:hypothetical protein